MMVTEGFALRGILTLFGPHFGFGTLVHRFVCSTHLAFNIRVLEIHRYGFFAIFLLLLGLSPIT